MWPTACTPPAMPGNRSPCGLHRDQSRPDGLIKRIDEYFDPAEIAPLID
jgi:hypothetical protein